MTSELPSSRPGGRFEALDALRGIAAFVVVFYHLSQTSLGAVLTLGHGYLAVDFFFVLSGVVIAHAYEGRLLGGMSAREFVLRRMIRLLPLSIIGALLGLLVLLLKHATTPERVDGLAQILLSGLFNLALLPTFFGGAASHHELFPGDGPLWSLFFEVAVNIAWAALLVGRSTRVIVLCMLACAVGLGAAIVHHGTANVGWDQASFLGGFPRVGFGFLAGVLLYRHIDRIRLPSRRWLPMALALALVGALAVPASSLWDACCVFVVLPALVGVAMVQDEHALGAWLGDLSYPVYVLHFPLLLIASGLRQKLFAQVPAGVVIGVAVAAIVLLAWLLLKRYDEPVRAWLVRRVVRRASSPRVATGQGLTR